jgi:hypothetical protein
MDSQKIIFISNFYNNFTKNTAVNFQKNNYNSLIGFLNYEITLASNNNIKTSSEILFSKYIIAISAAICSIFNPFTSSYCSKHDRESKLNSLN